MERKKVGDKNLSIKVSQNKSPSPPYPVWQTECSSSWSALRPAKDQVHWSFESRTLGITFITFSETHIYPSWGTFIIPERRVRSLKYAYKQRLRASCESNKRVLANNLDCTGKDVVGVVTSCVLALWKPPLVTSITRKNITLVNYQGI